MSRDTPHRPLSGHLGIHKVDVGYGSRLPDPSEQAHLIRIPALDDQTADRTAPALQGPGERVTLVAHRFEAITQVPVPGHMGIDGICQCIMCGDIVLHSLQVMDVPDEIGIPGSPPSTDEAAILSHGHAHGVRVPVADSILHGQGDGVYPQHGEGMVGTDPVECYVSGAVVEGPHILHDPDIVGACTAVECYRDGLLRAPVITGIRHRWCDVPHRHENGIPVVISRGIHRREGHFIHSGDREGMGRFHAVQGDISRAVIEGP